MLHIGIWRHLMLSGMVDYQFLSFAENPFQKSKGIEKEFSISDPVLTEKSDFFRQHLALVSLNS